MVGYTSGASTMFIAIKILLGWQQMSDVTTLHYGQAIMCNYLV